MARNRFVQMFRMIVKEDSEICKKEFEQESEILSMEKYAIEEQSSLL